MMTYSKTYAVAFSAAMLAATGGAWAATATDNLDVSLTVEASCSVVASPLAFGTVSSLAADVDGQATLDVTCSDGAGYTVSLDAGGGTGASTTTRKLTSGADTINYALYKDSARTSNFGSTGGEEATGTGNGTAQTIDVYGRVPSGQTAATGVYADAVTVTITYTP